MTRVEAIQWFKEIQNGEGVDITDFPDRLKGSMAKQFWHDSMFSYGLEYGVLLALIKIFDLSEEI